MRFGLPAILWGALLAVAWSRQRRQELPREKLLVWGFGLGLARELYMFGHMAGRLLSPTGQDSMCSVSEPVEHALAMAAIVMVAGSFLRYILDDVRLSRRYLQVGLGATAISLLATLWSWPRQLAAHPEIKFHQTWGAWLFHLTLSMLIAVAVVALARKRGWLRNVVLVALLFFFEGEFLILFNYATNRAYRHIICPIGNSFHILAIPLLGYVYLREQSIEKKQAEQALEAYRDHLEDLVEERTAELTSANEQLQREISERRQAEEALEQLSRQNELILESAGEGILGIDQQGEHIFVNPAAARMLGHSVEELIGQPGHATWHHSKSDGNPYPEEECPIHAGYRTGVIRHGDDQVFWRKDGSSFPVWYTSTPAYENGELAGAVVVFQDITDRKRAETEIAEHNTRLAAQNALAATLSQSLDLDMILNTALDMVLAVLDMETGCVFLLDPDGQTLALQIHRGSSPLDELLDSIAQHCSCKGISDQAVTGMRSIVLNVADFSADCLSKYIVKEGLQTLVGTPLVSKGRAVGALSLGARRPDAIRPQELELLTAIGQQIGMAVENARLYQEAGRWAEELTLLHQVSIFLTSTLDPIEIYDQMAEQSTKLLGCQAAAIFQWDAERQEAVGISTYGANGVGAGDLRMAPGESGILTSLIAHRQSITIEDALADPRVPPLWRERFSAQALLCLPVWGTGKPLGFLFMIDQQGPRRWRPDEVELIESFVNRAAVALENAHLHKQLQWAAALEERQRIAAEMHDGLAQTLSVLGLRADQATEFVESGRGQEALDELSHMRSAVGQASQEVRRSIASLQESPRPRQPLQDYVSGMVDAFTTDSGVPVDLVDRLQGPLFLPSDQSEQVQRVLQEALLNAHRHALPRQVTVCLEQQRDTAVVIVKDDGRGFDPNVPLADRGDHFGLSIMRARAARIGGRVEIDSTPGQGTRVILTWPLDVAR